MFIYRFKIDVFRPDTLPMLRLSLYMSELSKLLGESDRVHFVQVEDGSAVLVASVESPVIRSVMSRLHELKKGIGDPDALRAEKTIDNMLAEDGAVGLLYDDARSTVIEFPGRTRPRPIRYGPFREDGVIEGVLIRVGGKDASVPVWIRDGQQIAKCTASLILARQLAPYLLTDTVIRVSGSGKWLRDEHGFWTMDRFDIQGFEALDDTPLAQTIEKLRLIEGANWGDDPIEELMRLRRGEEMH